MKQLVGGAWLAVLLVVLTMTGLPMRAKAVDMSRFYGL